MSASGRHAGCTWSENVIVLPPTGFTLSSAISLLWVNPVLMRREKVVQYENVTMHTLINCGKTHPYIRSSLQSVRFGQPFCAHKRIVNRIKVYIERSNMQDDLIRFHKKYRLYLRLHLRSEEFNATRMFTLGYSLQQMPVR